MEKVPTDHLARPLYPFQRIQIDHNQMPPSGGFEYALVVVDVFSGWPEAFLVRNHFLFFCFSVFRVVISRVVVSGVIVFFVVVFGVVVSRVVVSGVVVSGVVVCGVVVFFGVVFRVVVFRVLNLEM
ncbi:unnamed protein product [Ranitomeya imitator]|uniref:Uncharacterized protein n=1 Tax=Ranitomeya imitator TaxID=111125 RepID=A0ABN9MMC2_9NEOB|nr:unnamed protein product [Ranitomeya imitator]